MADTVELMGQRLGADLEKDVELLGQRFGADGAKTWSCWGKDSKLMDQSLLSSCFMLYDRLGMEL